MKRFAAAFGVALLLAAAFVAGWVHVPYYAVGPGPVREVLPLIRVDGHPRYEPTGRLILTTVRFRALTPVGALLAWLDPDRSVVGEDRLFLPGESARQEERRARLLMEQSAVDAASVVLRRVTDYPAEHARGALVESVQPGCPADGALAPGDVIRTVEGRAVASRRQASRAIDAVPVDEAVSFTVATDEGVRGVELVREPCASGERPLVGITLIEPFPFGIRVASGEVGGSSAGLMWAVGLYDLLTPGDLTAGRTIAGTGAIDLRGDVGPIGGIADKVVAAREAGASVFLVPERNLPDLRGVDAGPMRLVPVSTFGDAIDALGASQPS